MKILKSHHELSRIGVLGRQEPHEQVVDAGVPRVQALHAEQNIAEELGAHDGLVFLVTGLGGERQGSHERGHQLPGEKPPALGDEEVDRLARGSREQGRGVLVEGVHRAVLTQDIQSC